jgi:hypothetical protein
MVGRRPMLCQLPSGAALQESRSRAAYSTFYSQADVRTTMGYTVGYHERGDEAKSIERAFARTTTVAAAVAGESSPDAVSHPALGSESDYDPSRRGLLDRHLHSRDLVLGREAKLGSNGLPGADKD